MCINTTLTFAGLLIMISTMPITKSDYVSFVLCPTSFYNKLHEVPAAPIDDFSLHLIEEGNKVGELARSYFPATLRGDTLEQTKVYLDAGIETIAEACFAYEDLYCAVDLLHKNGDGYDIYEVKSSTGIEDQHYHDAAFQAYVLSKCGLRIHDVYLMHVNNQYVRHGELDIEAFFKPVRLNDLSAFLLASSQIQDNLREMRKVYKKEPPLIYSPVCKGCPYHEHCFKDLPKPNVYDLNRFQKKYECLNAGIVSYLDVEAHGYKLGRFAKNQIDCHLRGIDPIIDKKEIKRFLDTVTYPVYHLDFESFNPTIPPCDDMRPAQQTPTQYSLHIQYEDGHLEHKEFLGETIDPRRAIAEALVRDIPSNVCVTAYHKDFECGRLRELGALFPDLSSHLLAIADHVVDLELPFRKGHYYTAAMGSRSSIKLVMPAVCPKDKNLDYHALELVHNGTEAIDAYGKMLEASGEEREKIRKGLLEYCCLDTLSMVVVFNALKEAVGE